jgi:ATP-dependent Clp protease ATP-binding subunit ClpX
MKYFTKNKAFFQCIIKNACIVLILSAFLFETSFATADGGVGGVNGFGGGARGGTAGVSDASADDAAGGGSVAPPEMTGLAALMVPQYSIPYVGLSVSEIFCKLKGHIVGEDKAMGELAIYCFRHLQTQKLNETLKREGAKPIGKNNLLMMGPSGSGKTDSVKLLAETVGVPFYEADTSTMIRSGYVGDSVASAIDGLLRSVNYDVARAEQSIVFFDEIDKIASKEDGRSSRDIGGADVQAELSKVLEGKKISVKMPGPFHGSGQNVEIDTSKILFIAAGTFPYLPKKDGPYTTHDIISAGFKKEFVGRFGKLIQLEGATEDKFFQIFSNPNSSIMRGDLLLLAELGINVRFKDEAVRILSKRAFALGTGAHGLKTFLLQITEPLFAEPDLWEGHDVVVDKEYIATHLPEPKKGIIREPWMDMYS